jgi:hypothetical protein
MSYWKLVITALVATVAVTQPAVNAPLLPQPNGSDAVVGVHRGLERRVGDEREQGVE